MLFIFHFTEVNINNTNEEIEKNYTCMLDVHLLSLINFNLINLFIT